MKHCIHDYRFTTVYNVNNKPNVKHQQKKTKCEKNIVVITAIAFIKIAIQKKNQIIVMWSTHFETFNKLKFENVYLCANNITINVTAITTNNYEKFFSKAKRKSIELKKLKRKISIEFHEYFFTFDFKKINKLLLYRNYNHKIKL